MKLSESRPLDFLYDNSTEYSGSKTNDRLLRKALISTAEKKIMPLYKSMFSNIKRFPAQTFSLDIETMPVINNKPTMVHRSRDQHDEIIKNSSLHITRPISKTRKFRVQNILDYFENNRKIFNNVQGDVSFIDKFAKFQISDKSQCMCTKGTQTIYRDSEIQTNPLITYALDMNYLDNNILHLTTRKQGNGIYIKSEDNYILEQMRAKRVLENQLITSYDHSKDIQAQIRLTLELEECKRNINDKKFGQIHELQLQETVRKMNDYILMCENKSSQRVKERIKQQEQNKNENMTQINNKKNREIRKLQKCTIPVEFDDFISSVSTQRKFYDKGNKMDIRVPKFMAKNCPCKWTQMNSNYATAVYEQLITK